MKNNTVCFAYFGDNQFIGWYADSFGSVRSSPKIYRDSESQIEVIENNFRSKIRRLKDKLQQDLSSKVIEALSDLNPTASEIMKEGFNSDEEKLSKFNNIELRMVVCPYYDGPDNDGKGWIYADYAKVKEWASNEPTTFLLTINA